VGARTWRESRAPHSPPPTTHPFHPPATTPPPIPFHPPATTHPLPHPPTTFTSVISSFRPSPTTLALHTETHVSSTPIPLLPPIPHRPHPPLMLTRRSVAVAVAASSPSPPEGMGTGSCSRLRAVECTWVQHWGQNRAASRQDRHSSTARRSTHSSHSRARRRASSASLASRAADTREGYNFLAA
jgi:hypothetical protein